ncbi:MAG: CBS domain-containing protein [Desulfonatronovibrionaceae bacterium]
MTKAKDIMSTHPLTVSPDTEIQKAAELMLDRNINGIPVVDDKNRLKGIICQSDLVAMQRKFPLPSMFTLLDSIFPLSSTSKMEKEIQKIAATKVSDAMTADPRSVDPETGLEELAEIMVKYKYHTLPVVQEGRLIGVVGKADVLKTLMRQS